MGTPTEITDHELLARWRGGDSGAGKELFARHVMAVTSFFRRNVRNTSDIPDLIQQTFLAVSTPSDRLPEGSVRAYIFGVAFHTMTRFFRKERMAPQPLHEGEADDAIDAASLDADPEYLLTLSDERRLMMKAIRRLPLRQQAVLELRFWEGLTNDEIASALGWPRGVVASRMRLAREALEKKLHELAESPEALHTTTFSLDEWRRAVQAWVQRDS